MQVQISGVIKAKSIRLSDGQYLTPVVLPADSEFTNPPVVPVRSSHYLGAPGDRYAGTCDLRGSMRPFTYTGKDGEKRTGFDFAVYFVDVEHLH